MTSVCTCYLSMLLAESFLPTWETLENSTIQQVSWKSWSTIPKMLSTSIISIKKFYPTHVGLWYGIYDIIRVAVYFAKWIEFHIGRAHALMYSISGCHGIRKIYSNLLSIISKKLYTDDARYFHHFRWFPPGFNDSSEVFLVIFSCIAQHRFYQQ